MSFYQKISKELKITFLITYSIILSEALTLKDKGLCVYVSMCAHMCVCFCVHIHSYILGGSSIYT